MWLNLKRLERVGGGGGRERERERERERDDLLISIKTWPGTEEVTTKKLERKRERWSSYLNKNMTRKLQLRDWRKRERDGLHINKNMTRKLQLRDWREREREMVFISQ